MCEETVFRICISLRGDFFNSITFTVISKYSKGSVVQISTVFCLPYHVACRRVLLNLNLLTVIERRFSESEIWEMHQL